MRRIRIEFVCLEPGEHEKNRGRKKRWKERREKLRKTRRWNCKAGVTCSLCITHFLSCSPLFSIMTRKRFVSLTEVANMRKNRTIRIQKNRTLVDPEDFIIRIQAFFIPLDSLGFTYLSFHHSILLSRYLLYHTGEHWRRGMQSSWFFKYCGMLYFVWKLDEMKSWSEGHFIWDLFIMILLKQKNVTL